MSLSPMDHFAILFVSVILSFIVFILFSLAGITHNMNPNYHPCDSFTQSEYQRGNVPIRCIKREVKE